MAVEKKKWALSGTRLLSACFVILSVVPAGCDLPGRPDPAKKFVAPDKVVDFAVLYEKNCAGCHGKEGKFGPAPPLNDEVFLAIVPEEALIKVIGEGRKGTEMPAFVKDKGGTLTLEQVKVLATGLVKHWGNPAVLKKDWPDYALPAEKGNVDSGKIVFTQACAKCHGNDGLGNDKKGAINNRDFLALSSEQVLRRFVITGRDDLKMPNCAKGPGRPLTPQQINDVVALLMSWKQ